MISTGYQRNQWFISWDVASDLLAVACTTVSATTALQGMLENVRLWRPAVESLDKVFCLGALAVLWTFSGSMPFHLRIWGRWHSKDSLTGLAEKARSCQFSNHLVHRCAQ